MKPARNPPKYAPRVLVVASDLAATRLASRGLKGHAGATVVIAADARSGRTALEHGDFDLVLSDSELPDGDGFEVARFARDSDADLAVIVMTAEGEVGAVNSAVRAGVDDVVTKPVDARTLGAVASRLVAVAQAKRRRRHAERPVGASGSGAAIGGLTLGFGARLARVHPAPIR